jgi:hypothetical protein
MTRQCPSSRQADASDLDLRLRLTVGSGWSLKPRLRIGAGLLIATGLYALVQAARNLDGHQGDDGPVPDTGQPLGRMQVTGLALSIDNLAVGFALLPRSDAVGCLRCC